MRNHILTIAVAFALSPSVMLAQDFEAGSMAYQAGDFKEALKEWRPLADHGNVDAQFSLGVMYRFGQGVPMDYAEAMKWFRLAAEQGHAPAQSFLGDMYYHFGRGVEQDYTEAVKWYRSRRIREMRKLNTTWV